MLSTAAVCFLIAIYAWRDRDTPVDSAIIFLMMIGITEWLTASALGYAITNPASKIVWAKIEYIGVVSVPLLVLIFSLTYSGYRHKLSLRNIALVALVPALTLLLAWTNEMHGLLWSSYVPYQENGLMFSDKTYGLWFWIYWVYSYLLLLAATAFIIRTALSSNTRVFRGQTIVLVLGILAPWLGNAVYVLGISPLGNLDLTPLAFAVTGIMLSLGIVRWRLFNIKPTAHVAVIENLADGLILLDKSSRIIDINPSALHIFGVNIPDTIGKHGSFLLPGELFSSELSSNAGKTRLEMKRSDDGIEKHFEITGTPFYGRRGDLMGRIVILHDTTELKRIQERLALAERRHLEGKIDESEGKYRALFDSAKDAIIIIDTASELIIEANRETEILFGCTRHEIINEPRSHIHPADKAEYYNEHFGQLIEAGGITDFDTEIIRKDEVVIPVAISASKVHLQGKSLIQYIIRDITERKYSQKKLKESEERYRTLFEKAVEGILISDIKTRNFKFANPSICAMLAYSQTELKNMNVSEIHPEDTLEHVLSEFEALARGDKSKSLNIPCLRKDGVIIYVDIIATKANIDGNECIVGFFIDATERKQAEARTIEMESLKRINQAKSELLANVSHELRTPLASIKGFIETLIETDVQWSKEEQLDFLQSANQEADRLTFLIRDLLDMSRIDSGKMVLDKRTYLMSEILDSAGNVLSVITAKHKLEIKIAGELPPLQVDKLRIAQVITNLVENAAKFSPEGSLITVEARPGEKVVVVSVQDKGEGMPQETIDYLFNRFYQAERVVSGKTRGTGLGLAICKGIVEAHGGQIRVESQVDRGSKFSFSLPVKEN
jgi:PAS domain S-box-containing protein